MDVLFSGVLGTLLGVLIASVVQTAREHRQWLRSQRLRVYAEFVRHGRELERAAGKVMQLTREGRRPSPRSTTLLETRQALTAVSHSLDEISLIGSRQARSRAVEFEEAIGELAIEAEPFDTARFSHLWDHPDPEGRAEGYGYVFLDGLPEFVDMARRELGNEPRTRPLHRLVRQSRRGRR